MFNAPARPVSFPYAIFLGSNSDSLDLFSEQSIGHYFSIAIRNKLFNILGPDVLPKPAKPAKAKPKPPARRAADQRAKRMAA